MWSQCSNGALGRRKDPPPGVRSPRYPPLQMARRREDAKKTAKKCTEGRRAVIRRLPAWRLTCVRQKMPTTKSTKSTNTEKSRGRSANLFRMVTVRGAPRHAARGGLAALRQAPEGARLASDTSVRPQPRPRRGCLGAPLVGTRLSVSSVTSVLILFFLASVRSVRPESASGPDPPRPSAPSAPSAISVQGPSQCHARVPLRRRQGDSGRLKPGGSFSGPHLLGWFPCPSAPALVFSSEA
jgi:hypothetical protein